MSIFDQETLAEYIRTYWSAPFPAQSDEAVEAALAELYRAAGLKAPLIIWLESPWQMTVAPMLLEVVLRGAWRDQLRHLLVQDRWKRCLDRILRKIDGQKYQLLVGPNIFSQQQRTFWHKASKEIIKGLVDLGVPADMSSALFVPGFVNRQIRTTPLEDIWGQAAAYLERQTSATRTRSVLLNEAEPGLGEQNASSDLRRQFSVNRPQFDALFGADQQTLELELVEQLGPEGCSVLASRLGCETGPADEPDSRVATMSVALLAANRFGQWAGSIASLGNQLASTFFYRYAYLRQLQPGTQFSESGSKIFDAWGTLIKSETLQFIFKDICLVCRLPVQNQTRDAQGRLHAEKAPALAFSDGFKVYSWHGTTIPEWLSLNPERLTAAQIESEPNLEVRRAMLEIYGEARFLQDSGAVAIQEDECGTLYRKSFAMFEEPLVMVRVRNSTAEPDGTYKYYYLRVPPNIRSAQEAVAWTFAMSREDYKPTQQT